jgi:DNA-binding transcriptional LysR family regulator
MDIRRLEIFCKVVELKSFTKAAESLSLAQPTVSEHMRILEDTLSERLLDRLGREVLPTPAGRVFYQYAMNIIRLREEAIQSLQQFKGQLSGHLILGASTIPGNYVLPKFIGQFKAHHPAIKITLGIGNTGTVTEQVLDGDIEAGVVGSFSSDRRIVSEELFSDELVLAVPPEHPWASASEISIDQLASEGFILRQKGSGTRIVMSRILEENGFDVSKLSVIAEMGSTEAIRQAIKARIGVSILSFQAIAEDVERNLLATVQVKGLRFCRPLYLIQRRSRGISPLCSAFLDYLRNQVKSDKAPIRNA